VTSDSDEPLRELNSILDETTGVEEAKGDTYRPKRPSLRQRLRVLFTGADLSVEDIVLQGRQFDYALKRIFGWTIFLLVVLQVLGINLVLFCHLAFGFGKGASATVVVAWISGVIVECIGLMAIVTGYLFPKAGSDENAGPGK
jgi:hypothetical protein